MIATARSRSMAEIFTAVRSDGEILRERRALAHSPDFRVDVEVVKPYTSDEHRGHLESQFEAFVRICKPKGTVKSSPQDVRRKAPEERGAGTLQRDDAEHDPQSCVEPWALENYAGQRRL